MRLLTCKIVSLASWMFRNSTSMATNVCCDPCFIHGILVVQQFKVECFPARHFLHCWSCSFISISICSNMKIVEPIWAPLRDFWGSCLTLVEGVLSDFMLTTFPAFSSVCRCTGSHPIACMTASCGDAATPSRWQVYMLVGHVTERPKQ